jgi:hypothetical protein
MDPTHLMDLGWSIVRGVTEVLAGLTTALGAMWAFGSKIYGFLERHFVVRSEYDLRQEAIDGVHGRIAFSLENGTKVMDKLVDRLDGNNLVLNDHAQRISGLEGVNQERRSQRG